MRYLFSLGIAALVIASAEVSRAATFTVVMGPSSLTFNPSAITIGSGDTIRWTNAAAATTHTSTSGSGGTPDNLWSSGSVTAHNTFSFTFTSFAANTYPYFCVPHFSLGMTGSVTVTNTSIAPPTVNITSPTTGTQLAAPADIVLMANATQTGGTVTNVGFFSGTTLLGNDTSSPYSFTLNGAAAGSYNFTAVAKNNQGGAATSSVVNVTVFAPLVSITNPITGAQFAAPANITLMANPTQTGGSITNVQFLSGANQLGNVTSAPFNFTVNGAAAGNYNFSAIALNNNGGAATSSVVTVFVETNAILSTTGLSGGQFQVTIHGIAGQTYETDVSSNLLDWVPLSTNVAPSDVFIVIDPSPANGDQRFYRTRQSF